MTKLDFGFALFQYSVVLIAIGVVIPVLLLPNGPEQQKSKKRWAYPLLIACFSVLVVTTVIQFVTFVQAFPQ